MALLTVNTGNFNDLFDDLKTALGTTLGWTLFDAVSVDEEIYTIPVTTGGFSPAINPSFMRLFRDTVAFSVRLTVFDSWDNILHVGTNQIPSVDATSRNILDFNAALGTAAYRIYGDAAEGYIAVLHDGSSGLTSTTGFWIGVLEGRNTPASHPNPNAILFKSTPSSIVACEFLDDGLTQVVELDCQFFDFNFWINATEQHAGKSPIVTAFAWFAASSATGKIAGSAKDFFQCSGVLAFGDTITVGADVHRVMRGGGYCIKE